jgi:hypothetical protein
MGRKGIVTLTLSGKTILKFKFYASTLTGIVTLSG